MPREMIVATGLVSQVNHHNSISWYSLTEPKYQHFACIYLSYMLYVVCLS